MLSQHTAHLQQFHLFFCPVVNVHLMRRNLNVIRGEESILWHLCIDSESYQIRNSIHMWIEFPKPFIISAIEDPALPSTLLASFFNSLLWYISAENTHERIQLNENTHIWRENTHTNASLHGFNCLYVCNYGSAGSRTEHLCALQWNTLWVNSVC